MLRATCWRSGTHSTAMIRVAPISRAPAVAQRPIGPWAKTATVSPIRTPPLSAPEKPVDMMSGHMRTCSSLRSSGTGARFVMASGTRRYSAWEPSMVLPKRQPPMGLKPYFVSGPSCERQPQRQAALCPDGVIAPATTRWPSWNPWTALPSRSMIPTGSWPIVRPRATGYSPLRMWMSVPQIVVVVMRMRASSGPISGTGFSSSTMRPGSTKIAAFMRAARARLRSVIRVSA